MNKKVRTRLLLITCLFVGCLLWVTPVTAQDYPKGPIQLVVPYAPGGAADLLWRILGDPLSKALKVPVAFVNKGGGGGIVGLSGVVNAKPDGYTLCTANSDTLDVTPLYTKDLPFDPINDVTFIAKVALFAQGMVVRTESPLKTIEEFVAYAKANPRKLKIGVAGVGSTGHLAVSLFNKDAGVELVPVPFGGGGEVVTALLGGHIDAAFMATMSYKSHYAAGKIRYLGFFNKKRHPVYPNVPTTVEKGFKNTVAEVGMALVGPKGLPSDIVKKWEETLRQVLKDPQVVQAIEKLDFVVDPENGEVYKKEIVQEYAVFKQIAAELKK